MNAILTNRIRNARSWTSLPAIAMTLISMALTLGVAYEWLGAVMPHWLALVVGLGVDGAWWLAHVYERRMARQGDVPASVTAIGWLFGLVAVAILAAHAASQAHPTAWAVFSATPLLAKGLWIIDGKWEASRVSPAALAQITEIRQMERDQVAVAKAAMRSQTTMEATRLAVSADSAARITKAQAAAGLTVSGAWDQLFTLQQDEGVARALASVAGVAAPRAALDAAPAAPTWEIPRWEATEQPSDTGNVVLTDSELDKALAEIRDSDIPPLSQREAFRQFRAEGNTASDRRLRESWSRITAAVTA